MYNIHTHKLIFRLSGRYSRFLSFSGRLILLKFVLTALPVYALSFFKAFSVDRDGLWRRVLVARYQADGGLEDAGRSCSSWWREIVRIRDGIGEGGDWFAGCVRRRVGDGAEIDFWRDCWCGSVSLCERFRRLYDLAANKVPLKVSIRLPAKSNLADRGITFVEDRFCVTGCGHVEDVNHMFFSCPIFGTLWPMV
ncbi:transmembrane protein, putative [Medicago truncatula]|uniref:Transmembrane protein, putative n=1 Tax=Medicago truncatula TaxID=3880 RepID=A0A072TUQ7_MEDTR|nr:transmembrane protein, putative [Medicago truncatula]